MACGGRDGRVVKYRVIFNEYEMSNNRRSLTVYMIIHKLKLFFSQNEFTARWKAGIAAPHHILWDSC